MTRPAMPARSAAARKAVRVFRPGIRRAGRVAPPASAALVAVVLGLGGAALGETAPDMSLSPQDDDPAATSARGAATYSVTFTGTWTTDVTPRRTACRTARTSRR